MQNATVKISEVYSESNILKPNYHLNYGKLRITTAQKNNAPFKRLGDCVYDIYTGNIFKRVFIQDPQYGTRYISAQHMLDINPLEISKLISNKFTPRQDDMTLQENQILISCAGTVGNVRLINRHLHGVLGSQDIIRAIADEKMPFGYLYAYLATPTAFNYIQSFIYGSVVPRIEPNKISQLPILIMDKNKTSIIHEKITQSYKYRDMAVTYLDEAIKSIELHLPDFIIPSIYSSKLSDLKIGRLRLDSTFSNKYLSQFYNKIEKLGFTLVTIKSLSDKVFTPKIFKRIKTDRNKNSVPYLGGAELLEIHPKLNSFLSKRTKSINEYLLERGWIAIQDSGSIQSMGYVSLVPSYLDGVAATNNLVRIIPKKSKNYNPYLFAFLKSKQGNSLIKSHSYGTGQLHIDNKIVQDLRVPVIRNIFQFVTTKVQAYLDYIEKGYELEDEVIEMIEKEISKWQK